MTDFYLEKFSLSDRVPYSERLDRISRWEVMQEVLKLSNEETIRLLIQAQLSLRVPEKSAKSYATHVFSVFIRQGWVGVGQDEFSLAMHALSSRELLKAPGIRKLAIPRIEATLELMHSKRH